jgi:hypothetical protein
VGARVQRGLGGGILAGRTSDGGDEMATRRVGG